MPVSFLLQLVPDALAQSRIVGQAKDIETGVTVRLRSTDDLLTFLFSRGEREGTENDEGGHHDKGRLDGDRAQHAWPEIPNSASGSVLEESPEPWQVSRQKRDGSPE